jgi:hypothetical protein
MFFTVIRALPRRNCAATSIKVHVKFRVWILIGNANANGVHHANFLFNQRRRELVRCEDVASQKAVRIVTIAGTDAIRR